LFYGRSFVRSSLSRLLLGAALAPLTAGFTGSPGPVPVPQPPAIEDPKDSPYPGTIGLSVDASDTDRRIVQIHETIPVSASGEMVLLYPQWLPGTHAPEGTIDRFGGLVIKAGAERLAWKRDVVNVFAFRVTVPENAKSLDVTFQYLSPVSDKVGGAEMSSTITTLEWDSLLLYPSGYFARQIRVEPSVVLPSGWKFGTALEPVETSSDTIKFKTLPLETLMDSPIYAGRYSSRIDLDPDGPAPVHLNVFADKQAELEAKPEQIAAHRALVQQAYKLYGAHHYDHYDFLFSISDLLRFQGLEHHRSSEDSVGTGYFAEYDKTDFYRSLLPHEFTHSWNGKFRRPADLWAANYNVPERDSLLWVYEGQTEYWGEVLTARSGLRTAEQEREALALLVANYQNVPGRAWRALQDTTNDEIINPRRPSSWINYQRFEDYYDEGALIWLDADTLIRETSKGEKSLDDFAKVFFGVENGSYTPVTFTFDDVAAALNTVMPYDWAGFLRTRLDAVNGAAPLDGLKRSGYRIVYNDTENTEIKSIESIQTEDNKSKLFNFSLGFTVGKGGALTYVAWDSPAFKAGLTIDMKLVAVNGLPYADDTLVDAIKAAEAPATPLEFIVKTADRFKVIKIDYHDGLRYPHLERDSAVPARLDDILAAKK
jgi:predicted metalloprotease with PDZ domain